MRDLTKDCSALALNTATLGHNLDGYGAGWSVEQVIGACAERGLGGLVFWAREIGPDAQRIGDRVRAAGMTVTGLCRTPYLVGRDAGNDDEIKASIDMAAALGTNVLTVVTGGTEPSTKGLAESRKRLTERVAWAAGYAAPLGVKLALEPLNPMFGGNRTVLMTTADALDVVRATGADNVGLAIDVYHVWWDSALQATLSQDAAQGRVFGFHLCDWLENTSDMLLDRGMMGDGVADLRAVRKAVEATGFVGACEVEIFSAQNWWKRDPAEVLDVICARFQSVC